MKFVKGISLFFIYPFAMFCLGVFVGVKTTHFFYPGTVVEQREVEELSTQDWPGQIVEKLEADEQSNLREQLHSEEQVVSEEYSVEQYLEEYQENEYVEEPLLETTELVEAASAGDTLDVDTEYVLEETDIVNHTVVETVGRLPSKYIGMNREQFLESMEEYEMYPPLSEMERGFVSLEVLSFSKERVVVQMNYQYIQPSTSFYLTVQDNEVIVYLEDKETVYINTGILLDSLPEEMQLEIIQMLWIEDEESLYNFLETYSS